VQAEDVAVAAHEAGLAPGRDAAERRAALGVHHDAGVHRHVAEGAGAEPLGLPEGRHLLGRDVERHLAGPAAVDDLLGAVLLRRQADRRRLDAQREVLRDDGDGEPVGREVARHGEDARVVVAELEPRRQHRHVRVVQLDPERPPVADRHGEVEAVVLHPQVVEQPQRLPGEVAELGVVPLALELADDHDGQHHVVLGEPEHGLRVGEQHRGVEHVGALRDRRAPRLPRAGRGGPPGLVGAGLGAGLVQRGHDDSISGCRGTRSHAAETAVVRLEDELAWPPRPGDLPGDANLRRARRPCRRRRAASCDDQVNDPQVMVET
jgi:hypothetical protein